MTVQLSINVNKVALVRNTRHLGIPSVTRAATQCLQAGAHGITVHPRPDERHIRPQDVYELAELMKQWPRAEFNIEGNPTQNLLAFIRRVLPIQATFVPDSEDQFTSDHGWSLSRDAERLKPLIAECRGLGVRVSLFMDPGPAWPRSPSATPSSPMRWSWVTRPPRRPICAVWPETPDQKFFASSRVCAWRVRRLQRRTQAIGCRWLGGGFQRRFDVADVIEHQGSRLGQIPSLQRVDDEGVLTAGLLGIVIGLEKGCDQRRVGRQIAQDFAQRVMAHRLGQADMEICKQKRSAGHVLAAQGFLLQRHVLTQCAHDGLQRPSFVVGIDPVGQDACLDDPACGKRIPRLIESGLHHIPAAARTHLHEPPCLQLHQGLANQRPADPEKIGELLLAEPLTRAEFLAEDGFDHPLGDRGLAGGHGTALWKA